MRTVCILTAGIGSRLKNYSEYINKSLLPIKNKSAISRIIENFSYDTVFVIAIGHFGNQVKNYLKIAHPKNKFKFVKIKNYKGRGTGPGLSLSKCKKYLQKPFYFISCDTLWDNKLNISEKKNWMGVSKKCLKNSEEYCNLKLKKNKILKIRDKKKVDNSFRQFIGLAFIKDYKLFWLGLEEFKKVNNEIQVSNGFNKILKFKNILGIKFNWYDIGSISNYKKTIKIFEKYDFSKENEFIYFVNKKVIKFFRSSKKTRKIALKSKENNKLYPKIYFSGSEFLSYEFIKGETLYSKINNKIFTNLLNNLQRSFWKINERKNIYLSCKKFYNNKTRDRLNLFFKKYNFFKDRPKKINGLIIPSINNILKQVPWNSLYRGLASNIHGDLQFDNIIITNGKNKFRLIDWREDFAKNSKYGDLYYDFAKLNAGIEINYNEIKKNNFNYKENKKKITYKFKSLNLNLRKILFSFLKKKKLSLFKVKLLTGIIFLNMSPLHKYPFDKLLFYHGKYILYKSINDENSK